MRYYYSLLAAVLLTCPQITEAGPILSVDMDPTTAGIQNSLVVTVGSDFTIDVVISDDGGLPTPTVFDTVLLQLSYNDSGAVLGAGPTGFLGGVLAGNNPGVTTDLFGLPVPQFSATGAPLTAGPLFPTPGFAAGSGAVGLIDALTFTILPNQSVSVLSLDFKALVAGQSTILLGGAPPGDPVLALQGQAVDAELVSGTVTVENSPAVIPEPHSLTLAGIGAVLLLAARVRRRNRRLRA